MADDHFWSWLAGFIDGDGCIGFWHQKQKNDGKHYERYQPTITITSINKKCLEYIKDNIGGTIRVAHAKSDKPHWQKRYSYCLHANGCREVINKIIPHLIIKKERATLMKKYLELTRERTVSEVKDGDYYFKGRHIKRWNCITPNENKDMMEKIAIKVGNLNIGG
jgi:hypothetical protein